PSPPGARRARRARWPAPRRPATPRRARSGTGKDESAYDCSFLKLSPVRSYRQCVPNPLVGIPAPAKGGARPGRSHVRTMLRATRSAGGRRRARRPVGAPGTTGLRDAPERLVTAIGDGWHAVAPAGVLALAGGPSPELRHWPLFVAAFGAQWALDVVASTAREWAGRAIRPGLQLRVMASVYAVDGLLAP